MDYLGTFRKARHLLNKISGSNCVSMKLTFTNGVINPITLHDEINPITLHDEINPITLHDEINPLKPELNPIFYLLALLGAHHFFHVSRIRVKLLTLR